MTTPDVSESDTAGLALPPADLPYLPAAGPSASRAPLSVPVSAPSPVVLSAPAIGGGDARVAAARGRRRAAAVGWTIATVLLGVTATGGYFGYREWKAGQTPDTIVADGPSAAGNTDQIIGGQEIDRVFAELDDEAGGTTADQAAEVGTPSASPQRWATVVVRRYRSVDSAEFVQADIRSDAIHDLIAVIPHAPADGAYALTVTDDRYVYALQADGTTVRVPRSDASLADGPDTAIAGKVAIPDVLPDYSFVSEIDLPGLPDGFIAYRVDLGPSQELDPAAYREWVTRWTAPVDPGLALGDGTAPQTPTSGSLPDAVASLRQGIDSQADVLAGVTIPTDGTTVVFGQDDGGRVTAVAIVSYELDLRVEYRYEGTSDEQIQLALDGLSWP